MVEIPPTSGVITTPDVLVVKLIPDPSLAVIVLACHVVLLVLIVFYVLQQVVGVGITYMLLTLTFDCVLGCVMPGVCLSVCLFVSLLATSR